MPGAPLWMPLIGFDLGRVGIYRIASSNNFQQQYILQFALCTRNSRGVR